MKKALLIAFAVLVMAGSIGASTYDRAYIGIYASTTIYEDDTTYVDDHSVCSIMSPYLGEEFEVWIWVLPSTRGVQAVGFMLGYPANVNMGFIKENPAIVISSGFLNTGIISTYLDCQYDWVWTHHQTISLKKNLTPRFFSILPHPQTGTVDAARCDEDYTLETLYRLNYLYFLSGCAYGTKEASWGAIKSLF